jgi:3-hydroxyacyl-CoA dehydrogenase
MSNVELRLSGGLAILSVDNPPVNALSTPTLLRLMDLIKDAYKNPAIEGVILIGSGKTFITGADLQEFGQPMRYPRRRSLYELVDAAPKLFVVAMHGHALGGGLELALAAHYRVALEDTRLGLPEVNVGMIPGAGGTQRLPRIVGPKAALEILTSGKPIPADEALALGILDELIVGNSFDALLRGAIEFTRGALARGAPLQRVRDSNERLRGVDPAMFVEFATAQARKWAGLVAPQAIVECVEAACTRSWDEGYEIEGRHANQLRESPQRAALTYVFLAERTAAKLRAAGSTATLPVASVAVIGAGTMGSGIAMAFANGGFQVQQVETSAAALERGRSLMEKNYETSVSRGSMSGSDAQQALARIRGTLRYDTIAECDLVIEAAFEDLCVKQAIFAELDRVMRPGALLATNTSTLDIEKLAAVTRRPESVVGMHFFSPANVMKLLEIVHTPRTSQQALVTALGVAKAIGKIPVLARNSDGFIGNRILAAYSRQADFLLEEGATPWQIDGALQRFGLPMGIYLMRDMSGLDIAWSVRKYREGTRDKSLRYSPVADRICELGRFGQKTGAGYYKYAAIGARQAVPDPLIEQLIERTANELGIERRAISDTEILERVLLAIVKEGARVVGEHVAERASDIDVTYVNGYGFPRYRGGPMFWAETEGLAAIADKVETLHERHGQYWEPAALLLRAAQLGSWKAAESP